MRARTNHAEYTYQLAQRYQSSNQLRYAYDAITDHFSKRLKTWEPENDKLVSLGLSIAFQISVVPTIIVKSCTERLFEKLPEYLIGFLDDIDLRLTEEKKRAETEAPTCKSPLLKPVDLPRLLHDSIVSPAIQYANDIYLDFLDRLFNVPKYEDLFHTIIRRAFSFCEAYNQPDAYIEICSRLPAMKSLTDTQPTAVLRAVETQVIRYETALKLKKNELALLAIDDAFNTATAKSVPTEIRQKIEEKKLAILQLTGRKHFTAIQRFNIMSEAGTDEKTVQRCLLETAAASIFDQTSLSSSNPINFPKFLKQSSGKIPTRAEFIHILRKKSQKSSLTDFVIAAEESDDPYTICEAYKAFATEFRPESRPDLFQSGQNLFVEIAQYAALRIIEKIRLHFTTIPLSDICGLINFLDEQSIQRLLIRASRLNLIPAHLDMLNKTITFRPRGAQHLVASMSPLNMQLTSIYNSFQHIKSSLPVVVDSNSKKSNSDANAVAKFYKEPREILERRSEMLKKRLEKISEIKERERAEKEAKMEEENKRKDEEERKAREIEQKKAEIRRMREVKYDFAMNEIVYLCQTLNMDVEKFLEEDKKKTGIKKISEKKAENLEWIQQKSKEIKVKSIKEGMASSEAMQVKMNKVKIEIGKERIHKRLARKKKLEAVIENEPKILAKLMKTQEKVSMKAYKEEMTEYENLKALCEAAKPFYDKFRAEIEKSSSVGQAEAQKKQPDVPRSGSSESLRKAPHQPKRQPTPEKPKEEVKAEEPKVEEKPVVEEKPKVEEKPAVEEVKKEPEVVEKPKVEETKKKVVVMEKPKPEEVKKEEIVAEKPKEAPKPVKKGVWGALNLDTTKPAEVSSQPIKKVQPQPQYRPSQPRPEEEGEEAEHPREQREGFGSKPGFGRGRPQQQQQPRPEQRGPPKKDMESIYGSSKGFQFGTQKQPPKK